MREVSKEEFYATVGPMDVIPRPGREVTLWETRDRRVIGKSTPGYMPGGTKTYFLREEKERG